MEHLIFTREYENVDGYPYPQPVERVNGLKYFDFTKGDKQKEGLFASLYWEWVENKRIKQIARFNSEYYKNIDKSKVYNHIKNYKHVLSVTPFFDFELYLMANGWDIFMMGGVNSESDRVYIKDGKYLNVGYGSNSDIKGYIKFAVIFNNSIYHLPINNFEQFIDKIWQA